VAKAAEARAARHPDTIEALLKVVADALRKRRRPPAWLQKGWAPKFIVDYHRGRLCAALRDDATLRDSLRGSDAVDLDVIALTSPAAFHDFVAIAADHRSPTLATMAWSTGQSGARRARRVPRRSPAASPSRAGPVQSRS
jgi:hypothetical protein